MRNNKIQYMDKDGSWVATMVMRFKLRGWLGGELEVSSEPVTLPAVGKIRYTVSG